MDPAACVQILASRDPQDLAKLRASASQHNAFAPQVIDISTGDVSRQGDDSSDPSVPASADEECAPMTDGAGGRGDDDRSLAGEGARLSAMATNALVRRFQALQEQRVISYRRFDAGLDKLLVGGAAGGEDAGEGSKHFMLKAYPQLCAETTASFASLSDEINAIEAALRTSGTTAADVGAGAMPLDAKRRVNVADLIRRLQLEEKEKLTLAAAMHLERIREHARPDAVSASAGGDGDDVSNKDKEYVRRRLGEVMGTINELLDELRCDLADECAEDDDA